MIENGNILYYLYARLFFVENGLKYDLVPLCLLVDDLNDETLNNKDFFFTYLISNSVPREKLNYLACVGITARFEQECELPEWLKNQNLFYWDNGECVKESCCKISFVKNSFSMRSVFNWHLIICGGKVQDYHSIRKTKNVALEILRQSNYDIDVKFYTMNRYCQAIAVSCYNKEDGNFYTTTFPTVTKLSFKEKLIAIQDSKAWVNYIAYYGYPVSIPYYFFHGLAWAMTATPSIGDMTQLQNAISEDFTKKKKRVFAAIATIVYIVIVSILIHFL